MPIRFIARIVAPHASPETGSEVDRADLSNQFRQRLRAHEGLEIALDQDDVMLATLGKAGLACGPSGIILGTLFARGLPSAVTALPQADQSRILATRGGHLTEAYWGPYVAILRDPDGTSIHVLRAPMGDLPCYNFQRDGATFLASDVDLLIELADYRPMPSWDDIVVHLADRYIHDARTCLSGIAQLPGGERLSIDCLGVRRDLVWSPWTFAARDRQMRDRNAAATLLRDVATACVGARASQHREILLTLSGGLDSSLVAACLADQGASFSGLTLVTEDAIGDERSFAGLVSQALHAPLTAGFRDVSRIDITHSGARHRPYPCVRGFLQESARLAAEAAADRHANAIFNGAGGDNIFCSLQSGAPVSDRLLVEGIGLGVLHTARAMSQFAQAGIPAVLRDAVQRAWLGKPAFRHRPQLTLLSPEARALAETPRHHPWLDVPTGTLPGKAIHVRMLALVKSYAESLDPQSDVPIVAPLLSQPLVETCLTIPSWFWFEDGHNRMVARRAFSGCLPPEILLRRSKGTPDSFVVQIFERHRAAIRAMLVDGELVRRGLIDLPGALRILDDPAPPKDDSYERILHFIDVEAWLAGWSGSGC